MFAGIRKLTVQDQEKGIAFPVIVFYPTQAPPQGLVIGPFSLEASQDPGVSPGRFPLVVLSHGNGSLPLHYRNLAMALAKSGFVVAMPEHHGNNRHDNSLADTVENLILRPRHIRMTIDAILEGVLRESVSAQQIAVIGHSMGGYAALAVTGGQPWAGLNQKIEMEGDVRIKALVLLAAAVGWFTPNDALSGVTVPILMYTAEKDTVVQSWQAVRLLEGVPASSQVIWKKVAGANHFSFLSPFPSSINGPHIPPSQDPPGFDRGAFQEVLQKEIADFLRKNL